jgi:glyoxylase-like metal-dependent hydrolase (beta-lactamase superfamily II)/predicted ester cyclase
MDVVRQYFDAIAAQDIGAAVACWRPGGVDRMVGQEELVAPDGVRAFFSSLFAAFPDWRFEVIDMTGEADRVAVRWRARATFAGPGDYNGLAANGARVIVEGCDVVTVDDGLIVGNEAFVNGADVARQLGVLPAYGSPAEARLTRIANVWTRIAARVHASEPELIADGVWILRGGSPRKLMNVYLIADGDGVTVYDGGIEEMTSAIAAAGARLGGIKRVVLGHVDCDHRGGIAALDAPVFCHEAEVAAARSDSPRRDYWDLSKLSQPARTAFKRLLPMWDGGAVEVAGTVSDWDDVAGFRVVELPGHAPGLIALFRESDRLALVSDCFYTLDSETSLKGLPRVPHPAWNLDTEQARAAIRTLAALEPSAAWAGHADPVTGDVRSALETAAATT